MNDRNSPPHRRRSSIQPDPFSPRVIRSKKRSRVWDVQENEALEKVLEEIAASLPILSNSVPATMEEDFLVEDGTADEDAPPAPELFHSLGPLGECGMRTWYHALNHPIGSISSHPSFVCGASAECIGGNGVAPTATANTDVVDRTWFARVNEARKGMDVLVSAEYI
jgi:hypothetical protein